MHVCVCVCVCVCVVKNDTNYVKYVEKLGREYYDVELNILECFTLLDVHLGLYPRKK